MFKWSRLLPALFFLLCFAESASAQGSFFTGNAWRYTPSGIFAASGATVTVCTSAGTGQPCTPKISLFSDAALSLPVANPLPVCTVSQVFGCIDGLGNFSFYASTTGPYVYTITGPTLTAYGPIPLIASLNPGSNINLTGIINCTIVNAVACISPSNPQGWAGADIGAWINSINANPAVCSTINCNAIQIAPGNYNDATAAVITRSMGISCPAGPYGTQITWTPATGIALTYDNTANGLNTSFTFDGCGLTTSTSTTSQAIVIKRGFQVDIRRYNINAFNGGGIYVTGNGSSTSSVGVRIHDGIIQNFCGASSFGVNTDHVLDFAYYSAQIYSSTDCATSIPMITDTGSQGLNFAFGTFEQGIHAWVIRNTNQGGAYGGAPAAIWANSVTPDASPGGDALLFDATLGTSDLKFFAWNLWAAFAGRQGAGTIITGAAVGVNIQGGSNIHFKGGTVRGNAGWGAIVNTTGSDISFDDVNVLGNNQNNTAGVGGVQVTANPSFTRLTNNRSGNAVEPGGHQAYGIDISSAISAATIISGNDLRNNALGRLKMPSGFGSAGVDAPDFGSPTGIELIGPIHMPQGTNFSAGTASEAVCGSNSTGSLTCSYNNDAVTVVPRVSGAITPGHAATWTDSTHVQDGGIFPVGLFTAVNVTPATASANTAADQNGMAITVTAASLNSVSRTLLVQLAGVYSTPAASTSVITDKLKLCTVSGCGSGTVITLATWTTTALGGIQATNDPFNCVLNATTQTAGASAAFEAHGNLTIDLAALSTAAESVFADGNTATVGTIDATAQLFLQHTKAFSNASASNSFTDRQMIADTVD